MTDNFSYNFTYWPAIVPAHRAEEGPVEGRERCCGPGECGCKDNARSGPDTPGDTVAPSEQPPL